MASQIVGMKNMKVWLKTLCNLCRAHKLLLIAEATLCLQIVLWKYSFVNFQITHNLSHSFSLRPYLLYFLITAVIFLNHCYLGLLMISINSLSSFQLHLQLFLCGIFFSCWKYCSSCNCFDIKSAIQYTVTMCNCCQLVVACVVSYVGLWPWYSSCLWPG